MLITFIRFRRRRLHGRRGLKYEGCLGAIVGCSRRLHGRRGLKCCRVMMHCCGRMSPPSRAAWIEILCSFVQRFKGCGSPPSRAAWIEIAGGQGTRPRFAGRRLHGRRGLKYQRGQPVRCDSASPPSRAAWIEIATSSATYLTAGSPPSRAAWIEIFFTSPNPHRIKSPPSRAAWIEIRPRRRVDGRGRVAAFTGGVD